jgi:hypothetical protein
MRPWARVLALELVLVLHLVEQWALQVRPV